MSSRSSVGAHVLTAVVTLALMSAWLGARDLLKRTVPAIPPARQLAAAPTAEFVPAPPPEPIPEEILKAADADEQINIRVYANANRSVVNITTAATSVGLFGDETTSGGSGSGFVIDQQGHILTNYHVVEGADTVRVALSDGSTHESTIVGTDASNDVAVLKVDVPAERLSPMVLGDSSRLLVGQKVLALGNPFGLERTLTTGIISSLDRSIKAKNGRTIKGIIQTDAAINPGNSGGPLLNSRGEVIGMNTAILSQVGQSAGISFTVPINAIKRILKPLIEEGHVTRADLGLARVFRTPEGLLVLDLAEGGPAAQAGLRPIQFRRFRQGYRVITRPDPESADLIVSIDGKPVKTYEDLLTEVESRNPGDDVVISVIREGREVDVPVTLGRTS
ncbi:S1C family serine protease [Tundrisphaera lichenicola]|uniref:S1C family serine protease n=1 Tax=Tundrisphaera lichenicola TaxID=2029860 RepID=UPI003EB96BB4